MYCYAFKVQLLDVNSGKLFTNYKLVYKLYIVPTPDAA